MATRVLCGERSLGTDCQAAAAGGNGHAHHSNNTLNQHLHESDHHHYDVNQYTHSTRSEHNPVAGSGGCLQHS